MVLPHIYKFIIIDITKGMPDDKIHDFFLTGEYDEDVYIYSKIPKSGYITFGSETMTAIFNENQRHPFTYVRISNHNNSVCVELPGDTCLKIRPFKTRELATEYANECIRKYLSSKPYHCTDRDAEMIVDESITKNFSGYFVEKDVLNEEWVPTQQFKDYFSKDRDFYGAILDNKDNHIYKE